MAPRETPRSPGRDDGDASRDRSQSAIAAAAKALNDATLALGDALRSASTVVSESLESEVAGGLRTAARTVDDVAANLTTRTRKRGRTRSDLLLAAARLVAERGYDATSVDDVASAAGYTKGAVYSHFGSKDGLFLAIFDSPCPLDHLLTGGAADTDPPVDVGPDRCVSLVHELMLFAQRTPASRETAAGLLARTLDASVDRVLAARDEDSEGSRQPGDSDRRRCDSSRPSTSSAEADDGARRAVLDELLVALALRHTLAGMRSVGVPQADGETVGRLLRRPR